MSRAKLSALVLGGVLWLALAGPAAAVPPGFDLFETDPDTTRFTFTSDFLIPASFFDPGSEPFTGNVRFGGEPLRTHNGKDVGDADTIIERPRPANLVPPFPSTDTIPIEIVALSLVSVEPITVTYGGQRTELWDAKVQLSPSLPSQGTMTITKESERGGTFDSTLHVIPLFRFIRRSDRATRTLDVGALPLQPSALDLLALQATDVPWRAGCVRPALAVGGLNDDFCPSFTPDGKKQLTFEQAQLARHGVRPAQPRLNHFKCYGVTPRDRFSPRTVRLTDQFGIERAKVLEPVTLCNPVKKNNERIENRLAHLKCYTIQTLQEKPPFTRQRVIVRNQFGTETVTVLGPESLCLPTRKQLVRGALQPRPPKAEPTLLTDHFKCYRAKSAFRAATVRLTDQFDVERARVVRLELLCNPVQKNREPIRHPVQHLACYRITNLPGQPAFRPRSVIVRNQFGVEVLTVQQPETLCVPSLKIQKGGGGPPPETPTPPTTPVKDFSLSCNPSSLSIPALGGSAQTVCTLTSVGGLEGQVSLACQNLPQGAQCQFSANPATLPANGSADVQVLVGGPPMPPGSTAGFNVVGTSDSQSHEVAIALAFT